MNVIVIKYHYQELFLDLIIKMCNKIKLIFFLCAISRMFSANPILEHALPKLSDYGFFDNPINIQNPNADVIPYTISSQLFSDYSEKLRFIKIPDNTIITHNPDHTLNFPVGTYLIKTFYYLNDRREKTGGRRLIETRILKKISSEWIAIPYVWNDEQTDALVALAGERINVNWIHDNGIKKAISYGVPNVNQCKSCHAYENIQQPIGPKIRNLNYEFTYGSTKMNQLDKWISLGMLEPLNQNSFLARTVNYLDENDGTLDDRARAWLDINCAHCHRKGGPAETSGLFLEIEQTDSTALGFYKPPIAAGRGSGNRRYNIVPGHPDRSILEFRISSTDPGIMMPELNRRLVDEKGVALIRTWIREMLPKY